VAGHYVFPEDTANHSMMILKLPHTLLSIKSRGPLPFLWKQWPAITILSCHVAALLEILSIFSTSVVLFRSRGRISPSSGSKIKNPTPKTFIYVIQIGQDSPSFSVTYIEIISVVENGFVSRDVFVGKLSKKPGI